MDPFGRQRGQSDAAAESCQQRHIYSQSQQRLPPFRTLLSENGSSASEEATYNASNGYPSPTATSPRYQNISSSSRAVAPSPNNSRAAMPSLSQGFDDITGRYPEQTGYAHVQSHRVPEYMLGSNTIPQYPEPPMPYSTQAMNTVSNHHFEPYAPNSNLPSIGEMHDRRDRMMRGKGNNGNVSASSFSNEPIGHFSSMGSDSEPTSYPSRRPSMYDQSHRSHTSYPALGSGHVTAGTDLSRYGQATFESSSRAYSSMYAEVDYSSQPVNGPQQPGFGVLGDSNDPRSKRRRGNLPKQVTDILRAWFHDHLDHPYPTEEDKQMFIARTGLSLSQISNWFINARRRQLPTLRNQVRSQEHGRSSHSHGLNERDHFSSHESSLSPR